MAHYEFSLTSIEPAFNPEELREAFGIEPDTEREAWFLLLLDEWRKLRDEADRWKAMAFIPRQEPVERPHPIVQPMWIHRPEMRSALPWRPSEVTCANLGPIQ